MVILSHFLINPIANAASSTSLRNFLLARAKRVVQIEQPFPNSKDKFVYVLEYKEGKLVNKMKYKAIKRPSWFAYLVHPLINLYFLLKVGLKEELAIACDNLSFVSVYPLRKLGFIGSTIYYSVDYVEKRFDNKLLNVIYHLIDRFALYNSDVNWVVNKKQIEARRKNGVDLNRCASFKVVPIGFRSAEIAIKPVSKIDYYHLVFCGTLRETAGPELPVLALPKIRKKLPNVHVTFVGGGDRTKLVELAKQLKIEKYVEFKQNIVSHKNLVNILTKCSIGLAPYEPTPGSMSINSDPGKIKLYLLCGLPVITTKVATSYKAINQAVAGEVISYSKDALADAVIKILADKKKYISYKSKAIKLGEKYDSDNIFREALGLK
ncbi:hypothetical protein A2803_03945 [Candidatus Woesebacteria bacterium RIFCSPHIGHO2_01_FULL_44_21]|uniref:Glycosyl transferase family 1 domain-containing protein n=1 Tax=Candidatus Woesebacteria bacterium RIFCSPHIGHO2_01_FULL_44_21 TaxID=1802503 RepID=A0A1F7YVM5_9BACT|nr:MAG: hypothetical protein A2803_03945 [Candidatus Woesebacteria bacterium RIFCSPHIGHO2_01_FULL_44_21]